MQIKAMLFSTAVSHLRQPIESLFHWLWVSVVYFVTGFGYIFRLITVEDGDAFTILQEDNQNEQ